MAELLGLFTPHVLLLVEADATVLDRKIWDVAYGIRIEAIQAESMEVATHQRHLRLAAR